MIDNPPRKPKGDINMNNPTPSKKPVGRPPHPATIRVRKLLLRHKASGGFKDRSFYVNKLLDEGTISYSVCHSIVTREMRRAKKVRVA